MSKISQHVYRTLSIEKASGCLSRVDSAVCQRFASIAACIIRTRSSDSKLLLVRVVLIYSLPLLSPVEGGMEGYVVSQLECYRTFLNFYKNINMCSLVRVLVLSGTSHGTDTLL